MPEQSAEQKSVFISYSRADLTQVRALAMAMRRAGLATWLDLDDLAPGQRWKEAISDAMAASDAMVFCISGLSLESAWTGVEVNKANALGLPILPVAIEAVDLSTLPEALRDLHVYDMSRHPAREAAALTAREIALAVGVPALRLNHSSAVADEVVDVIAICMDTAPVAPDELLAARSPGADVEHLDFSRPALIRLPDVVHCSSRARRAVLIVGRASDPALVGLVMGALNQAFGSKRLQMLSRGEAEPWMTTTARIAGVALETL